MPRRLLLAALFLGALALSCSAAAPPCGNGVYYADVDACVCYQCFSGPSCAVEDESCTIVSEGGTPAIYQEFWGSVANSTVVHAATAASPPDFRSPYQLNGVLMPGEFNTTSINGPLRMAIERTHLLAGNVDMDHLKGAYIVLGSGCTELLSALTWTGKQLGRGSVFASAPWYGGYKGAADGLGFMSFSNQTNLDPSDVVEFVTIPGNPDGDITRKPTYPGGMVVHDRVYWWPSLVPDGISQAADDIMLFSMSKFSGHAGSRFGWAVVKDEKVAQLMARYMRTNSLGISIDARFRALRVFQGVLASGETLFDWIAGQMAERWTTLQSVLSKQRFSIESRFGTFYAWIRCVQPADEGDCAGVFSREAGVLVEAGSGFGASDAFVRLELVTHTPIFQLVMKRLAKL